MEAMNWIRSVNGTANGNGKEERCFHEGQESQDN